MIVNKLLRHGARNGGNFEKRPMVCKWHSTFKVQVKLLPFHFEKMDVNSTRYPLLYTRYNL